MITVNIYEKILKRCFDIIFSIGALLILSPLLCILAILIRVKLGSPIIFSQERPGKNNKIFKMYKFRSMTNETDYDGKLLPDEMRMTEFGKFLRSTSLDELPEFWNVLVGDMSLIGPRPLLIEYLSLYTENQKKRHLVRPGLTGLAQVSGRNGISWEDKFSLDVKYVSNISFIFDIKIFFLTIKKVILKEGITSNDSITVKKFTGNK